MEFLDRKGNAVRPPLLLTKNYTSYQGAQVFFYAKVPKQARGENNLKRKSEFKRLTWILPMNWATWFHVSWAMVVSLWAGAGAGAG